MVICLKKYLKIVSFCSILLLIIAIQTANAEDKKDMSKEARVSVGEELFVTKKCSHCHDMDKEKETKGNNLRKWEELASPILWAAIMWNHVPDMVKAFRDEKINFPEFVGNELTYIFEYIHSFSKEKGEFKFKGDKNRGAFLFKFLGCKKCHVVKGKGNDDGPNLGEIAKNIDTDSEFANQLLTHVPAMCKKGKEEKLYWPMLQGNEVAHLFAYFKSVKD